jgi:pimeloyl-ACP methyl ester carboxylesterase
VLRARQLQQVVLVGHSLAGCVLQRFAAEHRELVAGLVFVDAIGDFARAGTTQELEAFALAQRRPTTLDERRAQFTELLSPAARPETTRRVLRALEHLDAAAWSSLREEMARFTPPPADPSIPVLAIEAAGNDAPVRYSALRPEVSRVEVPSSSHWLMLDQPEAFARALDDFLAAGRLRPHDAR